MGGLTIKSPAVLEILTSYLNVSEAAVTRNQGCGCDAAIIFSVRREDRSPGALQVCGSYGDWTRRSPLWHTRHVYHLV